MSALEERIKKAFDEITMPQGLKENTLKMIEEKALVQSDVELCNESPSYDESGKKQPVEDGATNSIKTPPSSSVSARQTTIPFMRRIGFALAACMCLLAIGFGGFSLYSTETAAVGIEMNPAIELGVNRFDTVVDARALNEDGKRVLDAVSVTGKSYDEALTLITQSDIFQSYINESSFVDVYVVCDDDRQSAILVSRGQQSINALPCEGVSNRVSPQAKSEAAEYGMGVGRYEAAQVLISLDPSLTIEDCRAMGMRELRMRIAELDPTNVYAWSQSNQGQGNSQNSTNQQGQGVGPGNSQGSQSTGSDSGRQGQFSDSGSGQGQQKGSQNGKSAN